MKVKCFACSKELGFSSYSRESIGHRSSFLFLSFHTSYPTLYNTYIQFNLTTLKPLAKAKASFIVKVLQLKVGNNFNIIRDFTFK